MCVEQPVGPIEPEQVLTLDVEHEDTEVGGARAHHVRHRGQHAQEEQRERGLGGHPRDPADGHVAALATIEEVEVDVDGGAVTAEPDG